MKEKKAPARERIKKANNFVFWLLKLFIYPVIRIRYNFRFKKNTSKGIKRPCLILSNHQVFFDIFGLGYGFPFGVNYVASDSLFRHGIGSWFMRALARPIPIFKGTSDSTSVKHIMDVIKQGGAVAMFPSGNRSFFGEECLISPTIGKLAKKLKVPLVLCQFHGGFLTKARWMAKPSRGRVTAEVVRVLSPEEMTDMTPEQINEVVYEIIGYNEYEWNRKAQVTFKGKHKAEYLEGALFYCPECHSFQGLRSSGNDFFCSDCGAHVRIGETGFFERVENAENIPDTILEWSKIQLEYVKTFDFSAFADTPVFSDTNVTLSLVERAKKQTSLGTGAMALYSDKISVCGKEFKITDIKDMALHGIRRMNIYCENNITYTVDAQFGTNLFKYMVCGYRLKNAALELKEEYYGY